MAEWIQETTACTTRKIKDYKDKPKKDKLQSDKAAEMRTSEIFQIWYRSFRTRYGRLIKRMSVRQTLTERDEWARAQFAFLKTHIYEIQRRTMVGVGKIFNTSSGYRKIGNDKSCTKCFSTNVYSTIYKL